MTRNIGRSRMNLSARCWSSRYYACHKRTPSTREDPNQTLLELIKTEHENSWKTCGSLRIHVNLRRKWMVCGHNLVARLMRVNQDYSALVPNQKWVSDFTYLQRLKIIL